jgi:hypothetical protein
VADLTQEQFEQLPEFVRGDYTQDGEVYRPVGELKASKLKQSLDGLDAKMKESVSTLESRLKEFESSKAAEIEAAKAKALEDARSKGDVKAIEERYQQQMADLEKRVAEKTREEVTKELTGKQAEQQASSQADKIGATLGVDKESGEALADLIRHRVKVDPETGKRIYHDAAGSALSVDDNGFIEELKKEARFKRLIKADATTTGGGMANGNGGNGGGAPDANSRADAAKKKGDLNGYLKAHLSP